MAAAPVDPGWHPPDLSLIEWVLSAAWAVIVVIGGFIGKTIWSWRAKVEELENAMSAVENDLRSIEEKVEERHRENTNELAAFRAFLTEEMRELRQRIDRLLERSR